MPQMTLFDTLKAEVQASPTGIVPRDYQQSAFDKAFAFWAKGSAGALVRQATGTGKTILAILIMSAWLEMGKNRRVVVLCHEIQLIDQFADEVEDVTGTRPGIEQGKDHVVKADRLPKITIASRDTLRVKKTIDEEGNEVEVSRLFKFDVDRYEWLVVIDECHRYLKKGLKSCKPIFEWFDGHPRLGLTATPERGDKRTLGDLLPDVAADYPLYDLDGGPCAVRDGWAVSYDQRFVVVEGVDFANIKEVAKDFDPAQLDEAIAGDYKKVIGLLHPLLDLVGSRRTIIFNVTIATSKLVAATINAWGPQWAEDTGNPPPGEAIHVDGTFKDYQRKDIYRRHQTGEAQFLVTCGLAREGYNDPGIQAVAVFRPTKSRGLAEQMKGRGCRPLRGCVNSNMTREERKAAIAASEKDSCMIIDLVGITGLADCASTAHILAAGKPDEVIERANKNALEKDGPIDMAEEVRKAQSEIDEEREQARLARIEQERLEEEEAERRAKLKADVRYSSQRVEQGHGARSYQSSGGNGCVPFGKHKGKSWQDVPRGYLEWVTTIKWRHARSAGIELARRRREAEAPAGNVPGAPCIPAQARVLEKLGQPTNVTYQEAAAAIAAAYPQRRQPAAVS